MREDEKREIRSLIGDDLLSEVISVDTVRSFSEYEFICSFSTCDAKILYYTDSTTVEVRINEDTYLYSAKNGCPEAKEKIREYIRKC